MPASEAAFDHRDPHHNHHAGEARALRQRDALLAMTMAAAPRSDDPLPAVRRITEVASRTLGVARVSVWRYNADRSAIRCVDLYESASGRHSSGAELTAAAHPAYFRGLSRTEVIAADDAHRDPRTFEFSSDYLAPLGITSMLDAPVHLRGVADGVLCHEHVGPLRRWESDEKTFALALANLVSLALEGCERVAAEQALRDSEKRLRAIFSGTHEYFAMLAPDGTLLEANRASIAFAPELMRDVIGRKFWDTPWFAFTPGMPEVVRRAVERAARGRSVREDLTLLHPSGRSVDFDFSLHPVLDEAGQVVLLVPEGRDITERKRAAARERELEAQLLQMQKMESIGTLAGGIAHDFNNILAAILGNAQLARDEIGPHHAALARLDQISASGERARGLVQQILAFSRRDPQERKVLSLALVVTETLAMLRAMLPSGVRLDVRLADTALHVHANATLLQQVLMNIGTNAWHALPDGSGSIEVGLADTDIGDGAAMQFASLPRGRYAHLWVTDSGSGMDEATLARVFEPFFTTKPVGRGTGLGLSVAHGIVAAHGGAIDVRSRPGAGTTVDLYLPLAGDEPAHSTEAELAAASPGRGQHVVYIDDDEAMAPVAEGLLRAGGYRVTAYADARAALHALRVGAAPVDLVVTDYNMPEFSGLHVARELARLRPGLPVVITSGFIDDELRRRAAQAGVRRLLNKEKTCEELCSAVGGVLGEAVRPGG